MQVSAQESRPTIPSPGPLVFKGPHMMALQEASEAYLISLYSRTVVYVQSTCKMLHHNAQGYAS